MIRSWTSVKPILETGSLACITGDVSGVLAVPIFEKINLETYSEWRGCEGKQLVVEVGTPVLILGLIGRAGRYHPQPPQHVPLGSWGTDVYKVLVGTYVMQVLRCQLKEFEE